MPLSGSSGIDIYSGNGRGSEYLGSIRPGDAKNRDFENTIDIGGGLRDYTINLPLYNGVEKLYIGFEKGAAITKPKPYKNAVPFLTYGSSITQGGCASHPGNAYQAYLSRWLDSDFINLGFSGSARGEENMAEYIAGLKMSVFLCDYDHNAPNPEHLEKTHEKFFRIIRDKNPELPVIFISKPDFDNNPVDSAERRSIILHTYKNALSAGDENVWFVDGEKLFGEEDRDACAVDRVHPNDLGFYRMAKGIYPALKNALEAGNKR